MGNSTADKESISKITLKLPASGAIGRSAGDGGSSEGDYLPLPRALKSRVRASNAPYDPFINEHVVSVDKFIPLAGVGRGSGDWQQSEEIDSDDLLVLEAEDGTTLITSAGKFSQDIERLYPSKDGTKRGLDISLLKDEEAATRGLGEWIWKGLSVLKLTPDGIVATAKDKALEILQEKFKDKITEEIEDLAYGGASWVGTKALMWAIESRLVGEPGLYHWVNDEIEVEDRVRVSNQQLNDAVENDLPILVFIHGTASSTVGSFGQLRAGDDNACWDNLTRKFGGRVYGFEHRTFSESPLENALELARILPAGARVSIVTHSRGGLVGDLFCLGDFADNLVQRYQRLPIVPDSEEQESDENRILRERIIQEEHEQFRTLYAILAEKDFKIERYLRVACPASGTTLLADNLDFFLSSMLSLFNLAVNIIPGVGTVGSTVLSAFRRVILEIAKKRIDPRLIPGIEAMLPGSPLTDFLACADRKENIHMAVIAGDADGDSGGYLKRIAIMLTDWIIFDHFDNDFVVDTQSMRAGLARRNPTREFFAHGHKVSHIHYFQRLDTRQALHSWLNDPEPQKLATFNPIPTDCEIKFDILPEDSKSLRGGKPRAADAPIIFYLPGIMGTHLEIRTATQGEGEGDKVWFDPFHLAVGGIDQINIDKANVLPEGLFQRYYGDLQAYLEQDHEVIAVPYDWRASLKDSAKKLAKAVKDKLAEIGEHSQRPISFLAHSMGGLVVRSMIAAKSGLWEEVMKRPGAHFVMLGTPNNGSHKMVETLLGKASSVRQLAMLDFQHNLQEILEVIDDFDGVLQLLPHSQQDSTEPKYFSYDAWEELQEINEDRWFRKSKTSGLLGATPTKDKLIKARELWDQLNLQSAKNKVAHAEKISYVHGLDGHTPERLSKADGKLTLYGTVEGDGSVTWQSGKLGCLQESQYWYMDAAHSELTTSKEHFPAIVELLRYGKTKKLPRTAPRTRSLVTKSYPYEAGPTLQPGAEDLILSFFGGRPQRLPIEEKKQVLEIGVKAMDLRFTQHPILCGHYLGDPIAGTEQLIDSHLLNGDLSRRERMGVYAGEIGTQTIVIRNRTKEEQLRGSGVGAIIVGLGEWSKITAQALRKTVRDGVLQHLLNNQECELVNGDVNSKEGLVLNSLLMGYNSTTHITIESSIDAITMGVCEANQQYLYNRGEQPHRAIVKLQFIEYYTDTAISAAYTVRRLPLRLEKELKRLQVSLLPASELMLRKKEGARQRLIEKMSASGYWSRLMVTDADQGDEQCPAECYEDLIASPIPANIMKVLQQQAGIEVAPAYEDDCREGAKGIAERLKYVYLSERARAEATVYQRQPGLIESLIKDSIRDSRYQKDMSHTLFQLMVPLEFKPVMRQTARLLLVLDGYTANLPWEMLRVDGEPLVKHVALIRQLVSTRFRHAESGHIGDTACVIGNPSTKNFYKFFPEISEEKSFTDEGLPSLFGAVQEANTVSKTLKKAGYDVVDLYPDPDDVQMEPSHTALDVLNVLFQKSYRILVIAAHGEVNIRGCDGKKRTGVVLSDGVMLTAAEIGQMEVVPDLVFLNCCHLAKTDGSSLSSYNRLAYSLARELIEMGVRCVIAAGWSVEDDAACLFSEKFFKYFVAKGKTFGDAVHGARRKTLQQHSGSNTWGAYQAYGDPNYRLKPKSTQTSGTSNWSPVALEELRDFLDTCCTNLRFKQHSPAELVANIERILGRVPQSWLRDPAVQYGLACLYGELTPDLDDGFERAKNACQQAIVEEDKSGNVPIKAIELLANLETKQAEKMVAKVIEIKQQEGAVQQKIEKRKEERGKTKALEKERAHLHREKVRFCKSTHALVDSAIERLQGLLDITHNMYIKSADTEDGEPCRPNAERFALLGSAYKRKAITLLQCCGIDNRNGAKSAACRRDIIQALKEARDNYKEGEGLTFDYDFNPYTMINRLQLDGLLALVGECSSAATHRKEHLVQLCEKAREAARRKFKKSYKFYDGVMAADAVVAIFLLDDEQLMLNEDESIKEHLIRAYKESIEDLPRTSREYDSVVKQIVLLADLLATLSEEDEHLTKIEVLQEVAESLS